MGQTVKKPIKHWKNKIATKRSVVRGKKGNKKHVDGKRELGKKVTRKPTKKGGIVVPT